MKKLIVDKNDTSKGPRQYEYLTARKDGTVFIGSTPDSTGPSSSDSTRNRSASEDRNFFLVGGKGRQHF